MLSRILAGGPPPSSARSTRRTPHVAHPPGGNGGNGLVRGASARRAAVLEPGEERAHGQGVTAGISVERPTGWRSTGCGEWSGPRRKGVRRMKHEAQADGKRFVYLAAAISALGGMLFGYDIGVISGAILFIKKDFSLSPGMEEIVVSSVLLGSLVGAAVGGVLADRLGTPEIIDRHRGGVRFGRHRGGSGAGHGMADCRPGRCRHRHRHRFVCRAALHFRDCPGGDPWKARFDQSSRPHQRHRHLLSDRLRLCRVPGVALDVCDGGDSGGRIWNRTDVHSQQPAMACRPRTRGSSPGRAETDSTPGPGGGRAQRDSA